MAPKLGPRLAAVARLVPEGLALADIGTDHGRLPAWLLGSGKVPHVIAADCEAAPLEGARHRLRGTRADLRLGDGLNVLKPGEVGTLTIAGMGGRRMIAILDAREDVRESLHCMVLQPQKEAEAVRRWLVSKEWRVLDEQVVEDRNRFYTVMSWEPGASRQPWTDLDYRYGPMIMASGGSTMRAWLMDELRHAEKNLNDMLSNAPEHARKPELVARCVELRGLLASLD